MAFPRKIDPKIAVKMHKSGQSYGVIAAHFGTCRSAAYNAVQYAIDPTYRTKRKNNGKPVAAKTSKKPAKKKGAGK